MMAVTVSQEESLPVDYPAITGLSSAALGVDLDALWQRLEAWIAYRFTARTVIWIVDGPGEWVVPLVPATIASTEVWQDDDWTEVTLAPAPLGGFQLQGDGPYRITASVGAGPTPAAVVEAFRRLAEWTADAENSRHTWGSNAGAKRAAMNVGNVALSISRDPNFAAHAMQQSGAADLLRTYRRP